MSNFYISKLFQIHAFLFQRSESLLLTWISGVVFFYSYGIKYVLTSNIHILDGESNILKLLFLLLKVFLFLYCLLGTKELFLRSRKHINKRSLLQILFISLGFIVVNSIFLILEFFTYPNFSYSKIGMNPTALISCNYFLVLSFVISSIYLLFLIKPNLLYSLQTLSNAHKRIILTGTFLSFVVFIIIGSFSPLINIKKNISSASLNYEQRFGPQYLYIEALAEISPDNSIVIHPQQTSTWYLIGNQPTIRYFLFPRKLVSAGINNLSNALEGSTEVYLPFLEEDSTVWPRLDDKDHKFIVSDSNIVKYKDYTLLSASNGKKVFRISLYE